MPRSMRIIMGSSNASDRSEHARHLVKKIAKQESDPEFPKLAMPRGVAVDLARFPKLCDDCGLTYWSRDEWGSHLGCRGMTRDTGF